MAMNIGRLADDNIRRFGEYDFLYYEGRWHTNVAMNRIANKLGNALKNMGIKKGDRVGIQLLNCPQLMQSFFATFKIGAILVPINPSLRVAELAYIYQDAGLSALISNINYLDNIKAARKEAPNLKEVIMIGDPVPGDMLSFDKVIEQAS
jgi:long-chain acyl-CoA synthetase